MQPVISSLVLADSLTLLKEWYDSGVREFIDLNYNDPTFNSDKSYSVQLDPETETTETAYEDFWTNVEYFNVLDNFKKYDPNFHSFLTYYLPILPHDSFRSYLTHMGIIYWFAHKMLKPTGSFYHHCDPTTSHYIKPILDKIFDIKNFKNEIAWCYKTGGVSKVRFAQKHDIIFFYSKSDDYVFNPQREPKTSNEMQRALEIHPEEFFDDNDGNGRYTWYYRPGHKKYPGGVKQYLESYARDYWDIPALTNMEKERLGLQTQKPEKLSQRVILASSNPEDLVVDLFNGSGTTSAVAVKLKRKFIGVDINYRMIQLTIERLSKIGLEPKRDYFIDGIPTSSKELRILVDSGIYGTSKNSKFGLQDVATKFYLIGVTPSIKKSGDHSIDGEFYFKFNNKHMKGIVQITSTATMNHLKAFGSEISKGTADIGVYVTFEDTITKGMFKEAKSYGKIASIDKFQILTFEELIDRQKQFEIPKEILNV